MPGGGGRVPGGGKNRNISVLTGLTTHLQVWEISSGVAASCGELTTPWPRGEDDIGQRVPSFWQYDYNILLLA